MITVDQFRTRFPGFEDLDPSDAQIEMFIGDAVLELNEDIWGDLYDLGLLYYTAHLLAMSIAVDSGDINPSHTVVGRTVGDMSESFDNTSGITTPIAEEWLKTSAYGQRFLALQSKLGAAMYVV
ncbi:MAG: hypothetical protein DRJ03_03260 [Chloroflexi bacterium]|nr:MAG: hypothetical protein DRJ03_03260 [Chloroflexota bacterium]